jgi:hypothetical protein
LFLYIHEISAAAAASAYERTDEDTDGIILVEDGPGFRCNVSTLAPSTSHPKAVDIIKYSYGEFRSHLSMYGEPAPAMCKENVRRMKTREGVLRL